MNTFDIQARYMRDEHDCEDLENIRGVKAKVNTWAVFHYVGNHLCTTLMDSVEFQKFCDDVRKSIERG